MQLNSLHLVHLLFIDEKQIQKKYAMNQIAFKCGSPRLPLIELSDNNKEKIKNAIKKFNY